MFSAHVVSFTLGPEEGIAIPLSLTPEEQGDYAFSHRSEAVALSAHIPSGSPHADTLVSPMKSSYYLDQE